MGSDIVFDRAWAMPNSNTYEIPPIREIVTTETDSSDGLWIDPFSGGTRYADCTNDLNPDLDADYHVDALTFLGSFEDNEVDGGVLFDPPYSTRQIKEVYESVGLEIHQETTRTTFWSDVKDEIARVCMQGATVVSCGWNSGGIGKTRGFRIRRIRLVAHGGWHNDTIVTVEDKVQATLAGSYAP